MVSNPHRYGQRSSARWSMKRLKSYLPFQTLIGTVKGAVLAHALEEAREVSNPHRYGQRMTMGASLGSGVAGFKPS